MKQGLRYLDFFLFLSFLILDTYFLYLLIDYKGLPDKQNFPFYQQKVAIPTVKENDQITTFNIGYEAVSTDYTFL